MYINFILDANYSDKANYMWSERASIIILRQTLYKISSFVPHTDRYALTDVPTYVRLS